VQGQRTAYRRARLTRRSRTMATTTSDKVAAPQAAPELPSADGMREIIAQKRRGKAGGGQKKQAEGAGRKKKGQQVFLSRKLTAASIDGVMRRVREAAAAGEAEILVGRFPSAWCSDAGRKINAPEAGWPETLPGIAHEFYQFWVKDLQPRGFQLRV